MRGLFEQNVARVDFLSKYVQRIATMHGSSEGGGGEGEGDLRAETSEPKMAVREFMATPMPQPMAQPQQVTQTLTTKTLNPKP
jgi:hypothetical protein